MENKRIKLKNNEIILMARKMITNLKQELRLDIYMYPKKLQEGNM